MPLRANGEFRYDKLTDEAVCYQLRMAEAFMSRAMAKYDEQPPELMAIAARIYAFGETFREVLQERASFRLLADRADWAAKHGIMVDNMQLGRERGTRRALGDLVCARDDRQYSLITIEGAKGQPKKVKYGPGFVLRENRHQFQTRLSPKDVRAARLTAPSDNRAALHAHLMETYELLGESTWARFVIPRRNDPLNKAPIVIEIDDVLTTELTDEQRAELKQAVRRA